MSNIPKISRNCIRSFVMNFKIFIIIHVRVQKLNLLSDTSVLSAGLRPPPRVGRCLLRPSSTTWLKPETGLQTGAALLLAPPWAPDATGIHSSLMQSLYRSMR